MRLAMQAAILSAVACHRDRVPDDTFATDSDSDDAWWEELPDGFDFRVEGRGHDGWHQFGIGGGTTLTCTLDPEDRIQAYGASARSDHLALYVLQATAVVGRVDAIDYTTVNTPYTAHPPSWTGAWRNVDFERDDPYIRPLTPDEQADCWMDVHFPEPYDELSARFECPWLREAPNEEDQGTISIVGTVRCPVDPLPD